MNNEIKSSESKSLKIIMILFREINGLESTKKLKDERFW